ncbi:unnamed protein product [Strongylus vulgaris]|uniref:Uncharacterized protein n=1 Tax=Strongylus vulgaris TaxID=40348 RepID=A0A3P7K498_STRVU|nr:unnamed protein product [Strongylus vulgaris]
MSKEVPQGPSRLPCSADSITKRKRDSKILPTEDEIDHEAILHRSLPIINTLVRLRYLHWGNINRLLFAKAIGRMFGTTVTHGERALQALHEDYAHSYIKDAE